MPHHKKWQGYYVIPSEILSVQSSVQLFEPTSAQVGIYCVGHILATSHRVCFIPSITMIKMNGSCWVFFLLFGTCTFLCPTTKSGKVLCYTIRNFECPSVHQCFIIECLLCNSSRVNEPSGFEPLRLRVYV